MPCYDGREYSDYARVRLELDRVTRLLCELCAATEHEIAKYPPDLREWWDAHKIADLTRPTI